MTTDNEAAAVEAVKLAIEARNAWLEKHRGDAVGGMRAAIAAHTAASAGEAVAWVRKKTLDAVAWPPDRGLTAYLSADPCDDYECVPLYTTLPAAVPADALVELIREVIDNLNDTPVNEDWARRTADRLAALIPKGADHGQR